MRKHWIVLVVAITLILSPILIWVFCGGWPDPQPEPLPWPPDAIIVLGGGDNARTRQAQALAEQFPQAPLVITGDGGSIVQALRRSGIPESRIFHETKATSTIENARFTREILSKLKVTHGVIVTNWFHVPRSLAVFRTIQPERKWAASFEARPKKLDRWNRACQIRERLATLHHLVFYRIWPF